VKNFFEKFFKKNLLTALEISLALTVTLISAIYYLGLTMTESATTDTTSIVFAVLTLISWTAITVLSAIKPNKSISCFSFILWGICFVTYMTFFVYSTTNLFADDIFEYLMLIFIFPAWSYMSIVEAFGLSYGTLRTLLSLAPAFILSISNLAVIVISFIKARSEKKKNVKDKT